MNWDIVIGIETHVQLKTNTKQFSGAPVEFGKEPNSQACLVSMASVSYTHLTLPTKA